MSMPLIKYCPGTLAQGFATYSPGCLRKLFYGKKVSHILNMPSPQKDDATLALFLENIGRISVSGFQNKLSLVLDKNMLRLTKPGEQGTHILKPIPSMLKKAGAVPANEQLTMQAAWQVYGIVTADNALIFFNDGTPAYITRRFDVKDFKENTKWGQEDMASLAGKTTISSVEKYDYSYEEIALLIQKYVPAWRVEMEKYFSLVLFNYLFSNGDAHLKNFSLLESSRGDYLLSPAYDLLNTRLHVDDNNFALDKGLFADNFKMFHSRTKSIEGSHRHALGRRGISFQTSVLWVLESVYCLLSRSLLFFPPSRAGQRRVSRLRVVPLKSNAGLVRPAYQIVEGRACSAPQDTIFQE